MNICRAMTMMTVMKKFGMISVRLLPVPWLKAPTTAMISEDGDEQPRGDRATLRAYSE